MQKVFWLIIGFAIIIGGWYLWANRTGQAPSETTETPMQETTGADVETQPEIAPSAGTAAMTPASAVSTVTYDGSSFSPSSVTIKKGEAVTFTSMGGKMWIASGVHPSHTIYDGTSLQEHCAAGYSGPAPFDQCIAGTSFMFTFDKTGTWGYHDHLNFHAHGTVTVK